MGGKLNWYLIEIKVCENISNYVFWMCRYVFLFRIMFFVLVIELEYSVDFGLLWRSLVRDCLFINVECSRYYL